MRALRTNARPSRKRRARRGFTLIELGIVILIIGIIVAFIAQASFLGTETARTRATQALISKLEHGIAERLDSLMTQRIEVNGAHRWLAAINPPNVALTDLPWGLTSEARAEAIARMDYIRMEMPDVFFIQPNDDYPVNFAGLPYNVNLDGSLRQVAVPQDYILPLGHVVRPGFTPGQTPPPPGGYGPTDLDPDGDGTPNIGPGDMQGFRFNTGRGIYGASYEARGALHKAIGYTALGTDGVDNNGNGLIDEYAEGIMAPDGSTDPDAVAAIQRFLANHQHETARSELLYALVVNGTGPLGAIFDAQDFRESEVRDTDGDGLPEFVDGWGKPLQFYRWPIYRPDEGVQQGAAPFNTFDARPRFPVDPHGLLLAPAWWGDLTVSAPPITPSPKCRLVQRFFTSLIDPNYGAAGLLPVNYWDRSGAYPRRGFGCKFLILSAGPDQEYGTIVYSNNDLANLAAANNNSPDGISMALIGDYTPANPSGGDWSPRIITSNGLNYWLVGEGAAAYSNGYPLAGAQANGIFAPPDAANDDVTNRNIQAPTGGIR